MSNDTTYQLRLQRKITSELHLRVAKADSKAAYNEVYGNEVPEFIIKVAEEILGRDGPSFVGKAVRAFVPLLVAWHLGLLSKKPELVLGLIALYSMGLAMLIYARQKRKLVVLAAAQIDRQKLDAAAKEAQDALTSSQELLTVDHLAATDPRYTAVRQNLVETNKRLLTILGVRKWPWGLWRFME